MSVDANMGETTLDEGVRPSRHRRTATTGLRRGTTLARYIVIDRLGGGGMGDVYSAWDEELRRRVALKVIRPREGTDVRERMLCEARALARLRHPHVVAVHDAGEEATDSNSEAMVYVAMEHLEGMAGADWIASDASFEERIRVILQCAEGLAAAHAQDLIHRDIKPSNVVIEARDSGPWAVLVDFGLAAPLDETTSIAGGTRAYMAPEYLEGSPADTRSDQWSLALMAVELLSGERPQHHDALAGNLGRCGSAVAPLRRALLRDPKLRFHDVGSFASALRRATRRTRTGWMLAGLTSAALVAGGIAAYGERGPSCEQQMDAARAEIVPTVAVDTALASIREDAPQVGQSVTNVMATWSQRWQTHRVEACAVEDASQRELRTTCLDQEAQRIMALLTVGAEDASMQAQWQIFAGLTRAVQADECAGADVPTAPQTPELARAMALEVASRLDEALEVAQQALDQTSETAAPELTARLLYRLASIQRRRGQLDTSLELGERAMQLAASLDEDGVWARAMIERVETLIGLGQADRALEAAHLARPAVAAAGDSPSLLSYWHYIHGRALSTASAFAEARDAHLDALEIRTEAEVDSLYLADSHAEIGSVSMRLAQCDVAMPHLQQAIDIYRAALGPGSPAECFAQSSFAQCQAQTGDFDAALVSSRTASKRIAEVLGPQSIELAKLLTIEGSLLGARGEYEASLSPFRRALEIRIATLGARHPETVVAQTNLGWLLLTVGKTDEATPLLESLVDLAKDEDRIGDSNMPHLLGALAALANARGRTRETIDFSERALRAAEASPEASNPLTLVIPAFNLAEVQEEGGDLEGARASYQRAWAILDEHPTGRQHQVWPLVNLALGRLSKGTVADEHFDEALRADASLADEVAKARG